MTSPRVLLCLIVLGGCSRGTQNGVVGTQNGALGTQSGSTTTAIAGVVGPFLLAQTSLLPGTTAVDPSSAAFMFESSNNSSAFTKIAGAIDSYFKLSDDGASTNLAIHGAILPSKTSTFNPVLQVSPNLPLKEDHWYTFSVFQGTDLQISNNRSLDDLTARSTSIWTVPIFTGSAPYVRAVQRPTGVKDGTYVRVFFSEPVRLEDLDPTLILSVAGRGYSKCILLGNECSTELTDVVSEVVDVLPMGPFGEAPSALAVNLGKGVRGSGRTVSEGIAAGSLALRGNVVVDSELSRTIVPTDWQPCQDGASECWAVTASK